MAPCVSLRLGRVIGRPPRHLVVGQNADPVFGRKPLNFQGFLVGCRERLFEHDLDLARRARLHDLQVPVVLHERPHDVRLHLGKHLLVIAEIRYIRSGFLRLSHQFGVGFGDGDEFGGRFSARHPGEVAPYMGVHQADDCDLVILCGHGQRESQWYQCGQNTFHAEQFITEFVNPLSLWFIKHSPGMANFRQQPIVLVLKLGLEFQLSLNRAAGRVGGRGVFEPSHGQKVLH